MTTRERSRDILADHSIGTGDLRCRRCGIQYGAIVEGELGCIEADERVERRPRQAPGHRRGGASDEGYRDPRRPGLAWIRAVCEPKLRRELVRAAEREDVTLSEVVRRACRQYVGID